TPCTANTFFARSIPNVTTSLIALLLYNRQVSPRRRAPHPNSGEAPLIQNGVRPIALNAWQGQTLRWVFGRDRFASRCGRLIAAHREAHKSLHFNIQGVTLALKQLDVDDVRVALGSTFNGVLSLVTKMLVEPWSLEAMR